MPSGQLLQRPTPEGPKSRILRALRLSPLFEGSSREIGETILDRAELSVVAPSAPLYVQGEPADALWVIGRGRARLERAAGNECIIPLGYRGSGDILGESCLGAEREHAESGICIEETEVVKLCVALLDELVESDPAVGTALFGLLLERRREVEDRIESLLFRNVEGRVVEFLLKAAERWGIPNPKGVLISAPITHLEIAQAIGSTRETVTLTLGALRRDGLLDVLGRRIIVKDREELARRYTA